MKTRSFLVLFAPIFAFIMSCGPVDNQDLETAGNQAELSAKVTNDGNLNLTEKTGNDWWQAYFMPSAFYYYTSPRIPGYVPNPFDSGWIYPFYGATNPAAPLYPWVTYSPWFTGAPIY